MHTAIEARDEHGSLIASTEPQPIESDAERFERLVAEGKIWYADTPELGAKLGFEFLESEARRLAGHYPKGTTAHADFQRFADNIAKGYLQFGDQVATQVKEDLLEAENTRLREALLKIASWDLDSYAASISEQKSRMRRFAREQATLSGNGS